MSKSEKTPVVFTGELRWVVVPPFSKPQHGMADKAANTHYSVEVECSNKQYNELIKKGMSRLTILRDDEETGKTFVRVRCPKVNGTYTAQDPVVKNADGSAITTMIGNGSEGSVLADIETFSTKDGSKATALRFHTIELTKVIPFERKAEDGKPHVADTKEETQSTTNEDW